MSIVSDKKIALYFLQEFEECLVKRINEVGAELRILQPNLINEVIYGKLTKLHQLLAREVYPIIKNYFD